MKLALSVLGPMILRRDDAQIENFHLVNPCFRGFLKVFMIISQLILGFLCKTANVAISIIEKSKYAEECDAINIQPINENFQNLIFFYPTLTFHWCYFLTLLGYEDLDFWSHILQLSKKDNDK